MAAKNDNTKQTIYNLKSVVLDKNDKGESVLSNDEIGTIKVDDVLSEYYGQEIDFAIGGAIKISPELFEGKDD
jgi:hypothetical protein